MSSNLRKDFNNKIRNKFLKSITNQCKRCCSVKNIEVHHITPISEGGNNEFNNLMVLCKTCHKEWHEMEQHYLDINEFIKTPPREIDSIVIPRIMMDEHLISAFKYIEIRNLTFNIYKELNKSLLKGDK